MARARSIKPGFFKNEKLADLPVAARLLFAGLWTIADRAGRLEDRPKRIRAEVFPYDNHNIVKLLDSLCGAGFIVRYRANGCDYIAIPTWDKHQNPHKNEVESTIPAPEYSGAPSDKSGTTPADSLNPEPDSLNPELVLVTRTLLDDSGSFREAVSLCELPASEMDLAAAKMEWKQLDPDQKRAALKGLNDRHAAGEFADPAFRPLPQNYLKKRLWQRPVRVSAQAAPTKSDQAMKIFLANMAEKMEKEQSR